MLEFFTNTPFLGALLVITVFCGVTFQNLFGIGLGLIVSPVMLVADPRLLPATPLILGILASAPYAFRNMRGLVISHCVISILARLVGSCIGGYILVVFVQDTSTRLFSLIFAGTLLVALVISSIGSWAKFFSPNIPKLGIASLISGISGTMTSIGGPPIALIYRLEKPSVARIHLNFMISSGAMISFVALAIAGFIGKFQLEAMAVLAIPALAGLALASKLGDFAHQHFKTAILGVIALSAIAILIEQF